ncbi:hypothetical protein EYF80_043572 [Liparis tanakae]|uniref:Uncharacterized protein n=1 Tax=Liparis tanakae TaxID=230148 RepID=A0A4Z2G126_9TELE|nr:hypothetical protein EYF80_043572 [Liparis tanakae]
MKGEELENGRDARHNSNYKSLRQKLNGIKRPSSTQYPPPQSQIFNQQTVPAGEGRMTEEEEKEQARRDFSDSVPRKLLTFFTAAICTSRSARFLTTQFRLYESLGFTPSSSLLPPVLDPVTFPTEVKDKWSGDDIRRSSSPNDSFESPDDLMSLPTCDL